MDNIKNIVEKTFNIKIKSVDSFNNRTIFMGTEFLLDLTIEKDCLNLETIIIPKEKRNKGLTKKFIKNLIDYIKESKDLNKLKISGIISSSLENICKNLNFKHEEFNYPDFDEDLYESFDGFFGSYIKILKEE